MYFSSGQVIFVIFHYFVFSASGQVILLIFHHMAPHTCKIRTRTEYLFSEGYFKCVGMVDAVFWNGAMYDCAINHEAAERIQQLLRWSISLDSMIHLKRLIWE